MPQDALTHAEQPRASHLPADRPVAPVPPRVAAPRLSRAFASLDEAVKYAHGQAAFKGLKRQSWFILKHAQKTEFIATQALSDATAPFDPDPVFGRDALGVLQLPEGFILAGLYCQAETAQEQLPPRESWLYENFFSPYDLFAGLHHARRARPSMPGAQPPPLFFGCPDGALLIYRAEDSELELALLPSGADWQARAGHAREQLLSGALPPNQWVRTLAAAGQLRVLHGSYLWNRLGLVDPIRWTAFADAVLAGLGPAFLGADDAARHAQQLIQGGTDKEFGGLIFQREDATFVATLPTTGNDRRFNSDSLYPVTETGIASFPPGHRLHAVYRSNISLSALKEQKAGLLDRPAPLSEQETRLRLKSITPDEVLTTLLARTRGVRAFYVLMTNANIIKYMPSGSDEEDALIPRLLPGNDLSDLDRLLPSEFIKSLAKTGALYVVRGDSYWGPPGRLPDDWAPYPPRKASPPALPAFGPLFDSADAAALYANERINGQYRDRRIGFIINDSHNRYAASEPLSAGEPLFAAPPSWPTHADGSLALPAGYRLAGLYYSAALYPQRFPCKDVWMYRNFFLPDELLAALKQIEAYCPAPSAPALPLYLSSRDGAQLKYRSRDIPFDKALLAGSDPSYGERLVKGILDPLNFIHALADSGELSVLQPSELWGPAGPVSSEWRAYRQLRRRVLGPLFASADDAARHAHGQIPRRYDKVYGGVILKRPDGLFVATMPLASATEIFDHTLIFPIRNGFPLEDHTIIGTYSSRLGTLDFSLPETEGQLYLNLFPTWDIYRAIKERSIPLRYFSAQDGSLIRYTSQHSPNEIDLFKALSPSSADPLNLMDNPTEQRFKSGQEADKGAVLTFVRDLVKAAELRVLVRGRDVWTDTGKVLSIRDSAGGVLVETDQALIATAPPAFSPLFMTAADAVRHALGQTNQRTQRSFGFIFRRTEKEYVATAPTLATSADFDRTLILAPDIAIPSLIPGYLPDGLYVSAPRREAPPGDRVYQHFISVRDFAHAIKTARETAIVPGHQSNTWIYLSSADGALFSYKVALVPDADEVLRGSVFHNDGIDTQAQLENGSLSGRDYVRRVAASGKLSVLQPGTLWRQTGPVSANWDPADGTPGEAGPYALSPFFAHADDAARFTHEQIGQGRGVLLVDAIYRTSAPDGYVTLEPFVDGRAIKVTRTLADLKTQELEQQRLALTLGKTPLDSIHYARPLDPARYQIGDTPCFDFFCVEDICFVTRTLLADNLFLNGVYYSSQEGALLKYQPRDSSAQRDLCMPAEPDSATGNGITPPHVRLINAVASAGKLSVLRTSTFWHKPGPIDASWTPTTAVADRRPRATRDLLPPLINSFNIGGVGATDVIDPQRALPVVIAPLDLKPRDRVDLYWGSHPDPVASHTQGGESGASHLTLRVATRWIMSAAELTVRYVLTPFPGGAPETAETRVRIKLDVPGDPDTQSATPTINDKLELPVVLPPGVIEDPEGVSVLVKRYANMAAGDSIVVSWHGRLVQHPPLSAPSDEVLVPIDPAIIREAGNSEAILVRYEIRDGVNNWSRWSRPALVEVAIGDPDLRAPVVPRAQGMQLNLDALNGADVQTLVLRYEGMSSAQTLRLLVERETALGATLPAYSEVKPGNDSDAFVSFEVPNEQFRLIIQGQARFYYYVEAPNQPSRRSKSLSLQIVGRALMLKPPRVPVAEANGNVLDPTQTGVIARVEPYSFSAVGQTVSLIWLGITAGGMEVLHEQSQAVIETERDIDFTIPDDQVSGLAGGSVVVRYNVKTLAPEPIISQPLLLPVSANPLDLPRPEVLEAHDSVLFPHEALAGATIRVSYAMEPHDSIQAYWRGTPGNGTPMLEAKPGSAEGSVDFAVPVTAVSANIGKRVEVGYSVTRQGIAAPSKVLPLDILPIAHEQLQPPFVREAPDNLLLDLNTFAGAAHIEVRKWPHIQVGQRIWLRIEGTLDNGRPYSFTLWNAEEVSMVADLVEGLLPRAQLDQLRDLSGLTFTFKVAFDGSSDESGALTFPRLSLTVRARKRVPELLFDSSPASLPGKIYLIPCHPRVLPLFGPGTTLQRAASGGVPGYYYSSDNPRIAVVDSSGKVSVRGNGQTTIRVSDRAGQRKSYPLSVSGVVQCYNLGEGSQDETLRKARQKGLDIPSLDELISIRAAYGKRWPLQSPLKPKTWSSTTKSTLGLVHAVLDMTLDVVEPDRPYIKITAGLGLIYEASGLGIGPALISDCKKARGLPADARELEKPRVEAALDDGHGLLPASALDAPVTVTFPVWSNPTTDETYQLLWGTELLGSPVFIGPGDNPGDTLALDIPVEALTHGRHELRYRAYDTISQASTDSFPSLIEVDREKPGQPLLAAMAFPPQINDGLTSAELTQLGNVLPGTIASYNGFAVGDQVTSFWGDVEGPGMLVMELKTIVIEFPRAFLASLGADADWPVSYRIRDRAGNLSERSAAITVKLRLSGGEHPELVFDQRPLTLSGKIYLIPSHPAVLPAFGPTTSARRQASGGTPGYTYTSGNPAIAVVDASGLVTVRGNGSTTISVSDAGGQMKSYSLSVSGVIHCHALGLGTFANMQAKAYAGQRRLPARAEFTQIHRLYGNRWPLGVQREWLENTPREAESTTSRDFGLTWSTDRATQVPPIKYYSVHLPSGKESILFDLSSAYGLGLS